MALSGESLPTIHAIAQSLRKVQRCRDEVSRREGEGIDIVDLPAGHFPSELCLRRPGELVQTLRVLHSLLSRRCGVKPILNEPHELARVMEEGVPLKCAVSMSKPEITPAAPNLIIHLFSGMDRPGSQHTEQYGLRFKVRYKNARGCLGREHMRGERLRTEKIQTEVKGGGWTDTIRIRRHASWNH